MTNQYKSKRKNKSWVDPKIHEMVSGYIDYASPKENAWYTSEEVSNILLGKGLEKIDNGRLGAYLTAAGFVKKRFGKSKQIVAGFEDNDFNWKIVNKWRVKFVK